MPWAIATICLALCCAWLLWQLRRLTGSTLRLQREIADQASRAETKLQTLFDAMVEGVLLLDGDDRIEFANLSLRRMMNLSGDIRGRSLPDLVARKELEALTSRVRVEGQIAGTEIEMAGPSRRHLQVNASLFSNLAAQNRGMLLVFHDLTRIKELENVRKEFVANVSHELQTPLSLIKGFVETLLSGTAADVDREKEFLRKIDHHAARLSFLIDDLLIIARMESGQALLNMTQVRLRDNLAQVVEDLGLNSGNGSPTIQNKIPADLSAKADGDRLRQVFSNLLENAVKYGRPGGTIEAGARPLPHDQVEVWISDDGPGIPPEARDRVFERFYRVDRGRSREAGGTGLGLAIVKHIVQAHGGAVWAQSEAGQGTTFFFTLPQA